MENSTNINWYPGHMAKAKREIAEDMKLIDVVAEILDARILKSSQNPDIQGIIRNKKKIILLNKCDLANENDTKKWQKYFKEQGIPSVCINANEGKGINQVISVIEDIMQEELEKERQKGRVNKTIRVLVLRNSKCTESLLLSTKSQERIHLK